MYEQASIRRRGAVERDGRPR